MRRKYAALFIVCCVALLAACSSPYLAPGIELPEPFYPDASLYPQLISSQDALHSTIRALERRGVREVRICRLHWIVAPTGAAIVQATGTWDHGGARFRAFSVGINDGSEVKYGLMPGDESLVVARGVDAAGKETYYYSGGDPARPRVLRFEDFEEIDELIFEFVSRETLVTLPQTCGLRGR